MADKEQDDSYELGKKIFFLNPGYSSKVNLIPALQEAEFETYVVDDYRDLKNILLMNPYSVCFINPDMGLPLPAWIALVKNFQSSFPLDTTMYGFVTEHNKLNSETENFKQINLQCGVFTMAGDVSKNISAVLQFVDSIHAKGRRRFVRATCFSERNSNIFFVMCGAKGSLMYQMKILDISCATVASILPAEVSKTFAVGDVIPQASISLNGRAIMCDLTVFLVKDTPKGTVVIFTFSELMDVTDKRELRNYVFSTLQRTLQTSIESMDKDRENYEELGKMLSLSGDF